MTDEELLRGLAAAARDERDRERSLGLDDPRLDALAEGTLDPDGEAALRAAIDAETGSAFSPIDAATRDRFSDAALTAFADGADESPPADGAGSRDPEPGSGKVLPFPRVVLWLAPLAAAAAIALFVLSPGTPDSTLPAYALGWSGGDKVERGSDEPGDVAILSAGSRFELIARPASDVPEAVEAAAFIRIGDRVEPWPEAAIEVAPNGSVRIAGETRAMLPGRRGRVTLLLVVARTGRLPDVSAVVTGGDFRVVHRTVEVRTE